MKRAAENDSTNGPPAKRGPWMAVLYKAMDDKTKRVYADDRVIVIKDQYPKAKHHFLVLPLNKLEGLYHLSKEHVALLEHIEKVGTDLVKQYKDEGHKFRLGYHAVPSLGPLHLHVISTDYNSSSLKTKKHWNSFTSEFFRDSKDVIEELKQNGSISKERKHYFENFLNQSLRCHRCAKEMQNIPKLKKHIEECQK